eukprot:6183191-Ditylum_brightwellii.AAC.1
MAQDPKESLGDGPCRFAPVGEKSFSEQVVLPHVLVMSDTLFCVCLHSKKCIVLFRVLTRFRTICTRDHNPAKNTSSPHFPRKNAPAMTN